MLDTWFSHHRGWSQYEKTGVGLLILELLELNYLKNLCTSPLLPLEFPCNERPNMVKTTCNCVDMCCKGLLIIASGHNRRKKEVGISHVGAMETRNE